MPLYFAYGSNMAVSTMARRCPRSRALSLARLARHSLCVTREGWLTATRDPNGDVWGVLWDLALSDVGELDRYEGVAAGLYSKSSQLVISPGGPKRALVYFGANAGPGVPREEYFRDVLSAARAWRLPERCLASLESMLLNAKSGRGSAASKRGSRIVRPPG